MGKEFPWDYHADLQADRLSMVAGLIVDGRQNAVELHDEEAGDNGWTLGCRAFQFGRARILRAADGDEHPWLSTIDRGLGLIFRIGEVPVRFYKGEVDEPTVGTLRFREPEQLQLSFTFSDEEDGRHLLYRFVIEPYVDEGAFAVKFVGFDGERPVLSWDVPVDLPSRSIGTVGRPAAEPVELPAPAVEIRPADRKRGHGGGD